MELENVLHFYIGCKLSNGQIFEPHLLLYGNRRKFDSGFFKLALRPLQYLTQEEIEHVLWLIHDSETHLDKDSRISKEEISGCIDSIEPDDNAIVVNHTVGCFIGKLYLSSHSGYLRLYDEDDNEERIEWKPELYAYLCKQGIDIFNLIPTNQAIDSTKL